MKLESGLSLKYREIDEIDSVPILEGEEAGPRWSFKYDRFKNDPTPDALILGAYRHPKTGNKLVGAINLRYLTQQQVDTLRKELPKLLKAPNLKGRYWTGRQILPEIFNNYYRTYNASHIRSLQRGAMYPKYGIFKTAGKYLKDKVTSPFKSKKQKEADAMPEYPDDLKGISDRLDDITQDIAQNPQQADTKSQYNNAYADVQRQRDIPQKRMQSINQQGVDAQQQIQEPRQQQQPQQPQQQPRSPKISEREKLQKAFTKDAQEIQNEINTIQNPMPQRQQTAQNIVPKNKFDSLDDQNDTSDIQTTLEYKYWCPIIRKYIRESMTL